MSTEIISTDKTIYYYFFSATPQVLAGAIALVGVFYVFAYRELRDRMKSIPIVLLDFLRKHTDHHHIGAKNKIKFESLILDFDPVIQYPQIKTLDILITSIDDFFLAISKNEPPSIKISHFKWQEILEHYRTQYIKLNSEITTLSRYTKICIVYNSVIIMISIFLLTSVKYMTDHHLQVWMYIAAGLAIIGIMIVAITIYKNIRPRKPDKGDHEGNHYDLIARMKCYLKEIILWFHHTKSVSSTAINNQKGA